MGHVRRHLIEATKHPRMVLGILGRVGVLAFFWPELMSHAEQQGQRIARYLRHR
jgi:hypothetical protein